MSRLSAALRLLALAVLALGQGSSPASAQAPPVPPALIPVTAEDTRSATALASAIARRKQQFSLYWKETLARYEKAAAEAKREGKPLPPRPTPPRDGTSPLGAMLYDTVVRGYPNDTVDDLAIQREDAYGDTIGPFPYRPFNNSGGFRNSANDGWEFIGPRNWYTGSTPTNAGVSSISGRVSGLAYHPTDSETIFLAAGGGGVWKTTDGGTTWHSLGDSWPTQFTGPLAINRTNPDILFVGLGDFNHSQGNRGGVMRTLNGGIDWTYLSGPDETFFRSRVSAIAIDPDNSNRIVITTGRGPDTARGNIYLSTDNGNSWSARSFESINWADVKISPIKTTPGDSTQPDRRFYFASRYTDGIYRSTDRGATWTKIADPPDASGDGFMEIEASPSPTDPNVLYVQESRNRRIWKGTRNPATDTYSWANYTTGFPHLTDNGNWPWPWYDFYLHSFPQFVKIGPMAFQTMDVLYSGLLLPAVRLGDSNTWADLFSISTTSTWTHSDQHVVAAFEAAQVNLLSHGNDGGIYEMSYSPVDEQFTLNYDMNAGLGLTMIFHGAFSPKYARYMMGGTQDNGTAVSLGSLETAWRNPTGRDGGGCAINPQNHAIQYSTSQNGFFTRTTDYWVTNSGETLNLSNTLSDSDGDAETNDGPFIAPLTIDPNYPHSVFYGGKHFLHRYDEPENGGSGWNYKVGNQDFTTGDKAFISAIGIAPSNSKVLYVGTSQGRVFVSVNRGQSWTEITTNLPAATITDFWIDPQNPAVVMLTQGGTHSSHVWRCTTATVVVNPQWTDISGSGPGKLPGLPTYSITVNSYNPDEYYVGTETGVYGTINKGASWLNATQSLGLPKVRVRTVRAIGGTGYLMIATYGRGFWRLPLVTEIPPPKPAIKPAVKQITAPTNPTHSVVVTFNNGSDAPANTVAITNATLSVGGATLRVNNLPQQLRQLPPATIQSLELTFPRNPAQAGLSRV